MTASTDSGLRRHHLKSTTVPRGLASKMLRRIRATVERWKLGWTAVLSKHRSRDRFVHSSYRYNSNNKYTIKIRKQNPLKCTLSAKGQIWDNEEMTDRIIASRVGLYLNRSMLEPVLAFKNNHISTEVLFKQRTGYRNWARGLKAYPHCRRKVRLSPLSRRFLRQSHFSAIVWTGLKCTVFYIVVVLSTF